MLGRLLNAVVSVALAALTAAPGSPGFDWAVDLGQGRAVHAFTVGGVLRAAGPVALLTLPAHAPREPVRRVAARLAAMVPTGSAVELLLRGRLAGGRWTPWQTIEPGVPTQLPGPAGRVQLRVLLTGTGAARATVRGLWLHAEPAAGFSVAAPPAPVAFQV